MTDKPMLTENQILALGMQEVMKKQASQDTVLLKIAEVVDAVTAQIAANIDNPELPEKSDDLIAGVDPTIIASLKEDLDKSKLAEDSPTDPDVEPNEVPSPTDPKIAGSLDDIIAGILEK